MAELVVLRLALPTRLAREPLDSLLASLSGRSSSNERAPVTKELRRDVLGAELAVKLLPGAGATCLYRAIARFAVLRKTGVDATFVMGIGPQGVHDDGHAWVEVDGRPFEEPNDVARYAVTFRFPTPSAGAPPPQAA